MPHGFVQQNARPTGAQHHSHLAGGGRHGVQLHDGLASRFTCEFLGRMPVLEKIERHATAATSVTSLRTAVSVASQHSDVQSGHRLPIEAEDTVAVSYQHLAK